VAVCPICLAQGQKAGGSRNTETSRMKGQGWASCFLYKKLSCRYASPPNPLRSGWISIPSQVKGTGIIVTGHLQCTVIFKGSLCWCNHVKQLYTPSAPGYLAPHSVALLKLQRCPGWLFRQCCGSYNHKGNARRPDLFLSCQLVR
jgi:hypothetical protein